MRRLKNKAMSGKSVREANFFMLTMATFVILVGSVVVILVGSDTARSVVLGGQTKSTTYLEDAERLMGTVKDVDVTQDGSVLDLSGL
jgi:hypothetical protein